MSTNATPPPVGTIMKLGGLRAEVVHSSPEYMVARNRSGFLRALQHVDGEWRDHDGDVWEAEPPTLPIGTVLKCGSATRTVIGAARGFVLVLDERGRRSAMACIDNGWRFSSDTYPWEVQP